MAKKIKAKKVQAEKITLGSFLTLLCLGEVMTFGGDARLMQGTCNLYNEWFATEKNIKGIDTCKNKDRQAIWETYPKTMQFGSIVFDRDMKRKKEGKLTRTLAFHCHRVDVYPKEKK